MREYTDHEGQRIRLTEERLAHITAYLTDKVKEGKLRWPKEK